MMIFFLNIFSRIPEKILYGFSSVLAVFLFYIARYRRITTSENIFRVFPEKTKVQRLDIEKKFYQYLADVVVETIMLSKMTHAELLERVEVVGLEHIKKHIEKNQSVILLSAHQGNWEWMLAAVSLLCPCHLDALYRPLHNLDMDQFFLGMRTRFGSRMIPADKALRVILKLRSETCAIGILGDQNPRRRDEKYWAQFMGVETPVVIGPERIAKMTGYPLFYVATRKLARGKYRCEIRLLAEAPYGGVDGEISQMYMTAIESHVRSQPECWMWSHHRWRYTRADCPEFRIRSNLVGR
jgi:KDO2-lipid IV(A) lauroyltransferase